MMQRVIQFITLALFWLRGRFYREINSQFSHDVTKIQTKKLSLLLSFYFHVILEHLKTFIQTNFQFTRILRFAIQDAWISRLLRDAAFSSRAKKALMWVKNIADFWRFCYVNIPCRRINIPLTLWVSHAKNSRKSRKTQKQMFLLVSGGHICAPGRDTNMAPPYKAL